MLHLAGLVWLKYSAAIALLLWFIWLSDQKNQREPNYKCKHTLRQRATFTKQGKLVWDRNPIKVLMGV